MFQLGISIVRIGHFDMNIQEKVRPTYEGIKLGLVKGNYK